MTDATQETATVTTLPDLPSLARDLRVRYGLDPSDADSPRSERPWLWRIPGKYGHVSVHGRNRLAVTCTTNRLRTRLLTIPGVVIHQDGDTEFSALFAPECLRSVCEVIKPKRRRVLTPDQRAALVARSGLATVRHYHEHQTAPGPAAGPSEVSEYHPDSTDPD